MHMHIFFTWLVFLLDTRLSSFTVNTIFSVVALEASILDLCMPNIGQGLASKLFVISQIIIGPNLSAMNVKTAL